jgi:hypothetical protein
MVSPSRFPLAGRGHAPTMLRTLLIAAAGIVCACGAEYPRAEVDPVNCQSSPSGWVPAVAVTPDAVPPCRKGSSGTCPGSGYRYVSGTGLCRPASEF